MSPPMVLDIASMLAIILWYGMFEAAFSCAPSAASSRPGGAFMRFSILPSSCTVMR